MCLGNTSILVKFDTGLADNLFFARHSKRPWSLGTADLIMRSDLRLQIPIQFNSDSSRLKFQSKLTSNGQKHILIYSYLSNDHP